MAATATASSGLSPKNGPSKSFSPNSDTKPDISKLNASLASMNGSISMDQSSSSPQIHEKDSIQNKVPVEAKKEASGNLADWSSSPAKNPPRPSTADESDDDDIPLILRKRKTDNQAQENGHGKDKHSPNSSKPPLTPVKSKAPQPKAGQSDDEDDKPLSARTTKLKQQSKEKSDQKAELKPDIKPDLKKMEAKDKKLNEKAKKQEELKPKKTGDHKEKKRKTDEDDDDDFIPKKKSKTEPKVEKKADKNDKMKDSKTRKEAHAVSSSSGAPSPAKKRKKEVEQEVWKWWEEQKHGEGIKWKFLQHKGPVFADPYIPLPSHVKFFYNGKEMKLTSETEEVATFYGRMIDHEYTTKDAFNKNFFRDWRKVMSVQEREVLTDLKKCDFNQINEFFKKQSEERKAMSKEEKLKIKEEKDKIQNEYGVAIIDGHKEKIGNFRVEPPGLFRGRGTHPKMGMLKKRIMPEDVIINCSKDSKIPTPPPGRKWKEVRHDNTVTWLASWTENIMGNIKYVMLNPSSKIKGEKDWAKYETARKLNKSVDKIRREYREDWKSKEMKSRQRAVALYFIDKLALRAGNEKEEGETADTVGCCSLRCEHIKLYDALDGMEYVVEFDFLGKDSIRYYNRVPVEKRVFKNLKLFMENKEPGDDLFDRLNTTMVNKYLTSLMDGLTAKVFRTYNASHTLQEQLALLTKPEMTVNEKLFAYNQANKKVAILCNHQRAVPKTHDKQMENLQAKIKEKEDELKAAKKELKAAKSDLKNSKSEKNKKAVDQKTRQCARLQDQLQKLQLRAADKEENKEIALGTSKLNYLDPRISVAWCKKHGVPIEKIFNKTQREKFRWAIDMAGPDFVF